MFFYCLNIVLLDASIGCINLLEKELTGIRQFKITGIDQRIESRKDYIKNLKLVVLESKSFEALDLQDLLKSNELSNDFGIIESVYTDELSFLHSDYKILSKFIHSMLDIVYPLTHESQDLSHDWDTPFRVCFITLKICCDKLFDRFDINSANFISKLIPIELKFHKARQ